MDSVTIPTIPRMNQELTDGIPPAECCGLGRPARPRYFPGQLLTDAELTAEQQYFMERLRMHNRHLHGWGVVCGLQVTCQPECDGWVHIQAGHAIDCCGNDIVLCEAESFDVIGYLKERAKHLAPECLPGKKREPDPCAGAERKYCLILSYAEEPASPITALLRDDGCRVSRCEPSRIKETFRFDLIDRTHLLQFCFPSLKDRIYDCIEEWIVEERKDIKGKGGMLKHVMSELRKETKQGSGLSYQEYLALFCKFRDYIQDLYMKNPHNVRCNICAKLHAIKFPGSLIDNQLDYVGIWTAFARLFGYVIQYVIDCICYQLLVACPECEPDDWVMLACITLEGDVISHICNLSRRWHQSPLQRQMAELHIVEPIVRIVEMMLKKKKIQSQKKMPPREKMPPKEECVETLEDRLEWMCCQADLAEYFTDNASDNIPELDSHGNFKRAIDWIEKEVDHLLNEVKKI